MSSPYTLRAAPLPVNFQGTPQQFFEAMLDRIEIVSDTANFVIQSNAPGYNAGPWLNNGTKWYVWSTSVTPSGSYVPVDISDSLNDPITIAPADPTVAAANVPAGIANYALEIPPKLPPRIWFQTDAGGTTLLAIWYNFGGSLGWQKGPVSLLAGSVPMTALQVPTGSANYIFAVDSTGTKIVTRIASIAMTPEPVAANAGQVVMVNPLGTGFTLGTVGVPTTVVSPLFALPGLTGALQWAHGLQGVPSVVRAVLVCVGAENGFAVNMEIDLHSLSEGTPEQHAVVTVGADITNCYASWSVSGSSSGGGPAGQMVNPGATSVAGMNTANWRIKFYALL